MLGKLMLCLALVFGSTLASGQETVSQAEAPSPASAAQTPADSTEGPTEPRNAAPEQPEGSSGVKTLSGMSILGNEEAPKSLVIVPWKSSEIGDGLGVDDVMDDRARPVDKEVFLREVRYYELRSGGES